MLSSEPGTIHIIGAGLAGLAAAVRLSDSRRKIVVHEATMQPGGRCRSYLDRGTGMLIDNGTHLLLSGNHAALSYAKTVGSADELLGPSEAEFPFVDFVSKERWTLSLSDGRFPWWVFNKGRRVPQTGAADYLPLLRLTCASDDKPIGEVLDCSGPVYHRLLEPLLVAALNTSPREGSAKLASAIIRETVALGGRACRPLLARDGIGGVFVEPALGYLRARGAMIALGEQLVAMRFSDDRVARLEFAAQRLDLGPDDAVILTVPAYVAVNLVPNLRAPTAFRGIVNAHFKADPPAHLPPLLGVINGVCEWIFARPGRISVTVSNANRLFDTPRPDLAQALWRDVAAIAGLSETLPPWQLVRERRATFAATPQQNALRPGAETNWSNLFLAGDWTATGLPATIESAVRSGYRAAELADSRVRVAA
jgi:squalene-associated FAD-dependent desaturase